MCQAILLREWNRFAHRGYLMFWLLGYNMEVMDKVRTRFAPSPTGFWHIGNVRTALFNYLFTRHNKGTFILRIEDTDRERYVPETVGYILEALNWLGWKYDEGPKIEGDFGPYIQSERLELYKKHAQELLDKELAYKDEGAIRFKTNKDGKTSWRDLIGDKEISFKNKTQEDFIILKSDGYPTYNFANVIDDHYMEVTHVIRGPEFISSTPKHIMLYQAFGWKPPIFGHVPMVLGTDRSKLSKRHGAKPILDYKKDGYLPEVMNNYLAFLGWTPSSEREILNLDDMIEEFDIKDVHVAPAVFDARKLEWMNGEYIRKMSDEELTKRLQEFLVDHPNKDKIAPLVPLVKERIKKLSDVIPLTDFIWEKPEYDIELFKKLRIDDIKAVLEKILQVLETLERPWKATEFEAAFRKLAESLGISVRDMFQLVRLAVSGQLVTPPLFESIVIMGEEEALKRVQEVVNKYPRLI